MKRLKRISAGLSFAILAACLVLLLAACGSFQSETTVFGIEITTLDSSTVFPTGRAGLIRHKNQLTQAGQTQQFYNGESGVNIWKGSLESAHTSMRCAPSASTQSDTENENSK